MGNSPDLIRAVIHSGQNQGEAFWELPLPEEYKEMLKTPYADVNNIGGPLAGASTAGLFLQAFGRGGSVRANHGRFTFSRSDLPDSRRALAALRGRNRGLARCALSTVRVELGAALT